MCMYIRIHSYTVSTMLMYTNVNNVRRYSFRVSTYTKGVLMLSHCHIIHKLMQQLQFMIKLLKAIKKYLLSLAIQSLPWGRVVVNFFFFEILLLIVASQLTLFYNLYQWRSFIYTKSSPIFISGYDSLNLYMYNSIRWFFEDFI